MIGVSKLLVEKSEPSDRLRYGHGGRGGKTPSARNRPIVVYNCVPHCNLNCIHCYSHMPPGSGVDLLSREEALSLIDGCADFGCPVLLFSGGEPLLRNDLFPLMEHAKKRGMGVTLSTNGTLITREVAGNLKKIGLGYVGVSLDGLEETHDRFRRVVGSFRKALEGIENCRAEGLRTGLRITLTKHNAGEVDSLFDLLVEHHVDRICFYHLVYTGRGAEIMADDLSHEEKRAVLDRIFTRTVELHDRGQNKEVLTVDSHADGPYLWMWAKRNKPDAADRIHRLISANRAKSTGEGISAVNWNGDVLPDQFWRDKVLGNVRERSFEAIWTDPSNRFLADLRTREERVKGKCPRCRFLALCRGGFRARAEARYGDMWAEDPACYLTEREISKCED